MNNLIKDIADALEMAFLVALYIMVILICAL